MPTDPLFLAVATFLVTLLWAGLRMTGTKVLGLAFIFISLGGLWALFQPTTPTLLWSGEVVILSLCALYGWYIYEPTKEPAKEPVIRFEPTVSTPATQVSSARQSVGIAGDHNTVIYNQPPNVKSEATQEISATVASYFGEGRGLLKKYESARDVPGIEAKKWSQKVARYLDSNLGPAYSVHFEDNDDEPKRESEMRETILALKGTSRKNLKVHRLLRARLSQLRDIMKELRGGSENYSSATTNHTPSQPLTEDPCGSFVIKMRTRELRWRAPGEDKDHSLLPPTPIPRNASFILYVIAEITAEPIRLVEEIGLEFLGQFLPARGGKTQRFSHTEKLLCFDISKHAPPGEHQVRLTARTSWNGGGKKEEKSPDFTVSIPHPSRY